MSAKHTPGPWSLDTGSQFDQENSPLDGFAVGYAEVGISIVTIRAVGQTMTPCPSLEVLEQIGLANANLMAAAPDMKHALGLARLYIIGEALPTKANALKAIDEALSKGGAA